MVEEVVPKQKVNDVAETVSEFMDKIAMAQSHLEPSIEVSDKVFDHYMRGQKTPYFYYQGIRVYKKGTCEEIERLEAMNPEQRQRAEMGLP